IWYAMGAVKTVGGMFTTAIIEERDKNGPYKSFQDFMLRVPVQVMNSRMVEALIKVGAFDALHPERPALLQVLPELSETAHRVQAEKESAQSSLFDAFDAAGQDSVEDFVL